MKKIAFSIIAIFIVSLHVYGQDPTLHTVEKQVLRPPLSKQASPH
jgi:hypothetical protein